MIDDRNDAIARAGVPRRPQSSRTKVTFMLTR